MEDTILKPSLSKAQVAKQLGVSRTYITLLIQGKRQPSQQLANKMRQLQLTDKLPIEFSRMQMGLEPRHVSAHDPKSCAVTGSDAQIKDSQAQLFSAY